jgi:hypothetical protein
MRPALTTDDRPPTTDDRHGALSVIRHPTDRTDQTDPSDRSSVVGRRWSNPAEDFRRERLK